MQTKVMTAAGDIVIRQRLYQNGAPTHPHYERTLEYLREGDVRWASCEVQFARSGFRTDAPIAYLVAPEVAADLGTAGFDLMTVATNHTWDYGPDAFLESLGHLKSAGITTVGGGPDLVSAQEPVIRDLDGLKLGILAVSCLLPPYYAARDDRPGISPARVDQWQELHPIMQATEPGAPIPMRSQVDQADADDLMKRIAMLRPKVDVLIVSVHWGYGKGSPLAEYQRPFGHRIIEAGADMILGNHAHSPAGLETHLGKPILYSLGNHIAQQDWDNATSVQAEIFNAIDPWSTVCRIEMSESGIHQIEFRATECGRDGIPILIDDTAKAQPILGRLQDLSRGFGTEITVDGATARITFDPASHGR
ncbi:CapA family protein [uncultured Sulfitobacter sp.]|uniref:CapA family protein n=1 Tax=uncultured Sulfitobacter sp. TaxID=191468 RepID=UPI00259222A5|nr:CapA family protein [uncultured Sulfitobacter sp.]